MTFRNKRILGRTALYLAVVVIVVFSATPLFWILLTSLKPNVDAFGWPPKLFFTPTLEHYGAALGLSGDTGKSVLPAFLNSIVVTLLTTLLALTTGTLAGYSLARLRPRGAGTITLGILAVRMLPPIALVVPMFQLAHTLRAADTITALIIPYTALSIPLATWMLYGFFLDLPRELEEAAIVDGCTRFEAFWRVMLPLAAPGLAATAVYTFLLPWNDLVFSLPLTTTNAVTLPVIASRARVEEGVLWGQLGAIASVMTIPVIIFTFLVQKYIVRGIAAGAVKQ
jgi:multiple sugar transport system permease protein